MTWGRGLPGRGGRRAPGSRRGSPWTRTALVAILPGATLACAQVPEHDPFRIPPETLSRLAEPVVLTPAVALDDLEPPPTVLAAIDSLVEAAFTDAGVPVVTLDDYGEVWERIVEEMGGLVDPESGEWDSLRAADARELLVDELWVRFEAGSLLYPELVLVEAPLRSGVARWDGAKEAVSSLGILADVLSQLRGHQPLEGWVDAVSLWVSVETMGGTEVYMGVGGLQLLTSLSVDLREWSVVSHEEIGAEPERLRAAVTRAIRPLVEAIRDPR